MCVSARIHEKLLAMFITQSFSQIGITFFHHRHVKCHAIYHLLLSSSEFGLRALDYTGGIIVQEKDNVSIEEIGM